MSDRHLYPGIFLWDELKTVDYASMVSELSPDIAREFLVAAQHIFATRYMTVAGLALLIYDHAITFRAEVDYVWPAKSSAVKLLFLLNRYLVPIFIACDLACLTGWVPWLTDRVCHIWVLTDIAMELFTLFSATFLIGMRVHVLWDNRGDIFTLVSIAWILHVAANLILVVIFSVIQNANTYKVEPITNVCMGSVVDGWTVWIPVMVYHFFIMVLLVIKSLSTPRNSATRIHDVMIRDGFNYFFVVFIALLFNLLSWVLAPPTLAALPRFFVWSVCTTATSRLLLSLKGVQSAEDWNVANNITRRDIELEPRNQIKFMFAEHEDDTDTYEVSRKSSARLKTTTLGRFDD